MIFTTITIPCIILKIKNNAIELTEVDLENYSKYDLFNLN